MPKLPTKLPAITPRTEVPKGDAVAPRPATDKTSQAPPPATDAPQRDTDAAKTVGGDATAQLGASGGVAGGTSPLHTLLGPSLENAREGHLSAEDIAGLNAALDKISDDELKQLGGQVRDLLISVDDVADDYKKAWGPIVRDSEALDASVASGIALMAGTGADLLLQKLAENTGGALGIAGQVLGKAVLGIAVGIDVRNLVRSTRAVINGEPQHNKLDVVTDAARLATSIGAMFSPLALLARVVVEYVDAFNEAGRTRELKSKFGRLGGTVDAKAEEARVLINELIRRMHPADSLA